MVSKKEEDQLKLLELDFQKCEKAVIFDAANIPKSARYGAFGGMSNTSYARGFSRWRSETIWNAAIFIGYQAPWPSSRVS
jgi:hypothetical protein